MIPLIPSLALAFVSFICSAFVILRIVVPILPPSPLSRRVAPSEFGLPNFRSLSIANKSQIWLHSLDIISLAIFVWQAISETLGGTTGFADAADPTSSVRLWLAMTLRQTCLLAIAGLTLLHVRMGRSVSFGTKHWMLWGPAAIFVITSTALAGVLSGVGLSSLYIGLVTYSSTIAVFTSVSFVCLVGTLITIKRNLAALEDTDSWPPMEEKPRPSFATEDIDVIRDGASWITSNASSHRNSISAWSFSTHHTAVPSTHGHGRPQSASHPSVPAKSSFWFGSTPTIPPVPPLPAPYGPLSPTSESLADTDPFRRECPTPQPDQYHLEHPRQRLGSQSSWLTSTNGSQVTLSTWSYPTTHGERESVCNASSAHLNADLLPHRSRPSTPALADAQVLGGYGYTGQKDTEKGLSSLASLDTNLTISVYHAIGWLIPIWVPLALAYPYLFASLQNAPASMTSSILFILSITISAPISTLNFVFCPLPIPSGLFDVRGEVPAPHSSSPYGSSPTYWSSRKHSTSTSVTTVVEGRRSGDVWVTRGDAVDGKGKMSRAFSLVAPTPKLSVLPPEDEDVNVSPPLPIQNEDSLPVEISTPRSETSAQFGRLRNDSKASSHVEESLAYASRIMIAQRHYSTLAQTVKVSTSPERRASVDRNMMLNTGATTGVSKSRPDSTHLRTRSVSSIYVPRSPCPADSFDISPPPAFPLPPTPPNVRAARLAKHKKSFSSGFSFGPVDDLNEIDALTAGVLPLLVPGLKVGDNIKIKNGAYTPPGTLSKVKNKKVAKMLEEFGGDISSPEFHSTPARAREPRNRKTSGHKRNHWSLPSLSLGKDNIHSLAQWSAEVGRALESKVTQYTAVPSNIDVRRNTVFGSECIPNNVSRLQALIEETESKAELGRAMSTRSLGLRPEVPHGVNTARSSIATLNTLPPSATATLFELDTTGPQAESTPHNNIVRKRISDDVPPMPNHRRSSIVYIKSDNTTPVTLDRTPPSATSAMASLAQWSSRAVRPLMPKASKLQRKTSTIQSDPTSKTGSPGNGLRPLSLLQERDANVMQVTRPLQVGKKSKPKPAGLATGAENKRPEPPRSKNRNLKSLQLVRSETTKMRGIMRKDEVLPDVIVRPPSQTVPQIYAYSIEE